MSEQIKRFNELKEYPGFPRGTMNFEVWQQYHAIALFNWFISCRGLTDAFEEFKAIAFDMEGSREEELMKEIQS